MTSRAFIAVAIVAVVSVAAFAPSRVEAQLPDCVSGGAVPAGNADLVKDCETLLNLMDDLRGSASLNWSETTPIGSWTGVRLGGSPQRVTIVKLQKRGLNGSIPAEIGSLDKLVDLWLYINELSGPLPAELGNLSDLETLMLANNNLSGQIPEALNDLTLNRLWLKGNNFTGCVPYNLTLVPDNDLSRVSLPACAPPSDGTPGPTPPPGTTPTPVPTATPTPPTEPPTSLSDMIKRVRPAIVKISNESDYFGFAAGTGFIFRTDAEDRSADILTNYHVVHELIDPLVKVNDTDWYRPEVLTLDPRRDLAMLRICCDDFTTVDFIDSDTLFAGDEVIAIGYPFDRLMPRRVIVPGEATITRGIISAFRYSTSRDAQLVQTDAPINPGNSGGPLFALNGQVVAINTSRLEAYFFERPRQNIGFSVLETTVQDKLRVWDSGPSDEFGPLGGRLDHEVDTYIEAYSPTFEATEDEFTIGATFFNPYSADDHQWDYGFSFGRTNDPNDQYLYFVVDSTGHWRVSLRKVDGSAETLHSGPVPQLSTGAGERNHLKLFVDGKYGWLYVNNMRVQEPMYGVPIGFLDLGLEHLQSHEGRVAVNTGLLIGSERAGAVTRFENFTGLTYDRPDE